MKNIQAQSLQSAEISLPQTRELIDHKIEYGFYEKNKQYTVKLSRLLKSGKNKGQYKRLAYLGFRTEAQRDSTVRDWIDNLYKSHSQKLVKAQRRAEIRANMKHPFEVGQILFDSWGYEQTNVDFYLITEVREKSIKIQRIGSKSVPGSEGFMSDRCIPDPETKIGEPILKIVDFMLNDSGNPQYFINSKYGWISEYDAKRDGVHRSWYA